MRILILGCGGIGSWLCQLVAFGIRNGAMDAEITLADGDIVEPKNLLYSNFDAFDVGKNKAQVLAQRYAFKALPKYVESAEEFAEYDLVIAATDDAKSRAIVYASARDWIDLRCKGRGFAVFANGCASAEDMSKTLNFSRPRESCQHEERLASRTIDYGNVIAASIGYQMLLNRLRSELGVKEFRGHV